MSRVKLLLFSWLLSLSPYQSRAALCFNRIRQAFDTQKIHISDQSIDAFCGKSFRWQKQVGSKLFNRLSFRLPLEARHWINELTDCREPSCLFDLRSEHHNSANIWRRKKRQSSFHNDANADIGKVIRKEIRRLTTDERQRYFRAIRKLKNDMVDNMSKYDILIVYHTPEYAPTAHFCPTFFPYHREYLKNFELAIRASEPDLGLPYWDTTMDDALPDPKDSILWTGEFFGDGSGELTSGPFVNFKPRPDPLVPAMLNYTRLVRGVGENVLGVLLSDDYVNQLLSKQNYSQFDYCVDPFLELIHGSIHYWTGGHMSDTRSAPNDPVFFFLHSFFDYIWEEWRHKHQSREKRETEFVLKKGKCNPYCSSTDRLKPFDMKETDGLSNYYTDRLYEYQPRPTCNKKHPNCDSVYLFCDRKRSKCLSKIKAGGNCTGYEGTDICFRGQCEDNICIVTDSEKTSSDMNEKESTGYNLAEKLKSTPTVPSTGSVSPQIDLIGPLMQHTGQGRNSIWSPITVMAASGGSLGMQGYTSATVVTIHESPRGIRLTGQQADPNQRPYKKGAVYAQIYSPFAHHKPVKGTIQVSDENGQMCRPLCLKSETLYVPCDLARFLIDLNSPVKSNEGDSDIEYDLPFTPSLDLAKFVNWYGKDRRPDKFLFICNLSKEDGQKRQSGIDGTASNSLAHNMENGIDVKTLLETTTFPTTPRSAATTMTSQQMVAQTTTTPPPTTITTTTAAAVTTTAAAITVTTTTTRRTTTRRPTTTTSTTTAATSTTTTTARTRATPKFTTASIFINGNQDMSANLIPKTTAAFKFDAKKHREFVEDIWRPRDQVVLPSSIGFQSPHGSFVKSIWRRDKAMESGNKMKLTKKRIQTSLGNISDKARQLFAPMKTPGFPTNWTADADFINGSKSICQNKHACCSWWATVGECGRSSTIRKLCPKQCEVCADSRRGQCLDNNIFCSVWARDKQCEVNPPWMLENCRVSCKMCDSFYSRMEQKCRSSKKCYNYHQHCEKWADENECILNKAWMHKYCPRACNLCLNESFS